MKKTLFIACAILSMLGGMVANASILSTFDSDNENWTVLGLATLSHENNGGNPGGFLVAAEAGGDTFEVVAPSKFLGELLAFKGGTLSFDSKLITTDGGSFGSGFGKVTILGGGASAELDLAPNPPETNWVTYSAQLISSNWGVSEAIWDQILANVTEIRVILESVVGWETMGFDNFKVQTATPQILSAFNFNNEGWVAECADLAYVTSGGNPGGHITLIDNCPGSTVAYLPPKFFGNLSQFDGGVISFDVRSLYPINSIGSGFGRIQMNGPVLNATHDFAPYPQVPSNTKWTTYYVPFTAEAWEVSGNNNWADLIKNVTAIHITLGDVAFDNFRISKGVASTYDIDDEGWTADGALLVYVSEGGNSGGFVSMEDNAGDSFIASPPAKFIGNLTRFNGGMLSYEIKSLTANQLTEVGSGFGRITIIGGGHSAMLDYAPYPPIPSNVDWTPYYAPMTASAWHVTEEVWQAILANVTDMYIVWDGAGPVIGMDNFTIMPPIASTQSFASAFGSTDCTGSCFAEDIDGDGDVDGKDLATFLGL